MSKRKARSSEEEELVAWKPFIKILEKPNVSNRLLEYLCSLKRGALTRSEKQRTHRNWIDNISEIWKRHPSPRIQKLADKSIKNYKVTYLIYNETKLAEAGMLPLCPSSALDTGKDPRLSESYTSVKDGGHGDPLLSLCGRILCFSSPSFNGILSSVGPSSALVSQSIAIPCLTLRDAPFVPVCF